MPMPIQDNLPLSVILDAATRYKASSKTECDFRDYEHFKGILHRNGYFGHEKELADILGV